MPSLQSKFIVVLLHLTRMKRTVNRMRRRVESGTRAVFLPDCRKPRERAAAESVTIDYREV